MASERIFLTGPFERMGDQSGELCWVARGVRGGGDDSDNVFRSTLRLYEDGRPFSAAHEPHWSIAAAGGGRYSHWADDLFFSTGDGSDPNGNGRRYEYDLSLDLAAWDRGRNARAASRWDFHPRTAYFRERGGDLIPPPLYCNIGLTNKCNLRCEICGSQKFLDETGTRRRHMELDVFEAVAETIFPVLRVVELNSQGDPLLYPHVEKVLSRIAQYGCDVKIQHNGTLLTGRVIDLLLRQHGTIMLSLDAVGEKFNEVRRGGNWARALPGLERLTRERDPARLALGVYPTLTARTIGEALNVAEWCAGHGLDELVFHRYSPIAGSFETAPGDDEYAAMKERVRTWCQEHGDPLRIMFEGESLNHVYRPMPEPEPADPAKSPGAAERLFPQFPTEAAGALKSAGGDPVYICAAPRDYVEIGLDGQVGACCRAQEVALGYATSVEAFADAWFGTNYRRLRQSLQRGAAGRYPLPNCEGCVKFFAPVAAGDRRAVDYTAPEVEWQAEGLDLRVRGNVRLERFRKETGHCYISVLPMGVDGSGMELWEDDLLLGPTGSLHDEIREAGSGRYHIGPTQVYFAASDNSDPRHNDRTYLLKAMAPPVAADGTIALRASWIAGETGHCHVATLPPGLDTGGMELWEDDRRLPLSGCLHDDIRNRGGGRYHVGESSVYFSASDNSDARLNGRHYALKPAQPAALAAGDG